MKKEAEKVMLMFRTPLAFTANQCEVFLQTQIAIGHAKKHAQGMIDEINDNLEFYTVGNTRVLYWKGILKELNKEL